MSNVLVVGLVGKAGAGKTTVAKAFVPGHSVVEVETRTLKLFYDHMKFAGPLYELVGVSKIEGEMAKDRRLYAVRSILENLFGTNPLFGGLDYDSLESLVHLVEAKRLGPFEGDKPRKYMQDMADWMKFHRPYCFTDSLVRRIQMASRQMADMMADDDWEDSYQLVIFIDDLRFDHEIIKMRQAFKTDFIAIGLDVPDNIRLARLSYRDGIESLDEETHAHNSEKLDFMYELCDVVIEHKNHDRNDLLDAVVHQVDRIANLQLELPVKTKKLKNINELTAKEN